MLVCLCLVSGVCLYLQSFGREVANCCTTASLRNEDVQSFGEISLGRGVGSLWDSGWEEEEGRGRFDCSSLEWLCPSFTIL